jgi:restriction endonuclease S subunit
VTQWPRVAFAEIVQSRGSGASGLPQSEWKAEGKYPVIGQGAEFIEGWTNRDDLVLTPSPAVVLYGGHTRRAKFVDRPFVPGPNVKILEPLGELDAKFLYYFLSQLPIESRGYADHFSEVRRCSVPLLPLHEQQRISEILDRADALRAKRRAALAQLDTLTQSIFLDMFGDPRKRGSTGKTPTKPALLGALTRIRTGKLDANAADEDGAYPFFTCAVEPLRINTPAFDCTAVLVAGNGDLNVKYYEGKFNAYQRTYVIESVDESVLVPQFLYAFLDLYVSELRKQAIGGVIKYIKLPYLTEAVVQLPSEELQRQFARRLGAEEKLKAVQRASLTELDALFATLQDRVFRGVL